MAYAGSLYQSVINYLFNGYFALLTHKLLWIKGNTKVTFHILTILLNIGNAHYIRPCNKIPTFSKIPEQFFFFLVTVHYVAQVINHKILVRHTVFSLA